MPTDYMHLTKRFGIVAASQLPLHCLLAVKSACSPLPGYPPSLSRVTQSSPSCFRQSHPRLLVPPCIILPELLRFLIDLLAIKLQNEQVILGLFSITLLSVVGTSALSVFRRWNYRAFYTIHAIGSTSLPIIIYFHVPHVRPYATQCMVVSLINITTRLWCTESVPAIAKVVDGTNIINLTAKHGRRLSISPGQHMYLRARKGVHTYCEGNPFTVASVSGSKTVLMVRVLKGNTKRLQTTILSAPVAAGAPVSLSVGLEGAVQPVSTSSRSVTVPACHALCGQDWATYAWPLWRQTR